MTTPKAEETAAEQPVSKRLTLEEFSEQMMRGYLKGSKIVAQHAREAKQRADGQPIKEQETPQPPC